MNLKIDPEGLTPARLYVSLRQASVLKKLAERRGLSVSALVRLIIDGWLLSGGAGGEDE